jgi:succinyl-CoA synthetase beta subunit
MIIAAGGRPANHTDISPGPTPDKMKAVFDAIFENPRTKSLLIGFNHLQMAPADRVIEALVASLADNPVDPRSFPIVVRVFGPAEKEARELAATVAGIHYLPRSASLKDGVDMIVELNKTAPTRGATT